MKVHRYAIVPVASSGGLTGLRAASRISGMHPDMIPEVARARLVVVAERDGAGLPFFDRRALERLELIQYLRLQQRANLRTVRMIVRLIERAERAERELRSRV